METAEGVATLGEEQWEREQQGEEPHWVRNYSFFFLPSRLIWMLFYGFTEPSDGDEG